MKEIAQAITQFLSTNNLLDKLDNKPGHDAEGKENGKRFLSSGRMVILDVPIQYQGKEYNSSRVEISIIARDVKPAAEAAIRKQAATAKRAVSSVENISDPAVLEAMAEKALARLEALKAGK